MDPSQTALLDPLDGVETPQEALARRQRLASHLVDTLSGDAVDAALETIIELTDEFVGGDAVELGSRLAELLTARREADPASVLHEIPSPTDEQILDTANLLARSVVLAPADRVVVQVGAAQVAEGYLRGMDVPVLGPDLVHAAGCDGCTADAPCETCLGAVTIVIDDDAPPAAPAPAPASEGDGEPATAADEGELATDGAAAAGDGTAAAGTMIEIDPANPGRFRSVLLVEGERTVDDRMIDPGATTWRPLPIPWMLMVETQPGHLGARIAGRLEVIEREGNEIVGYGAYDTGADGIEGARLSANQVMTGVSVDPGDVTVEVEIEEYDEEGFPVKWLEHYTTLTILGATQCPMQAITSAHVEWIPPDGLTASAAAVAFTMRPFVSTGPAVSWEPASGEALEGSEPITLEALEAIRVESENAMLDALTAGAGITFPAEWFLDPKFTAATALAVTDDGRVFGHLALFGECHTGWQGECVLAPRSRTNYAYFRSGAVSTTGGEQAVGTITLATLHAGSAFTMLEALKHYEDTGLAAAYVNIGEDAHGIWIAGALRPGLSDEKVTELMASKLSGDWRDIAGNLELAAALGVNTPGYPVARIEHGRPTSLVAALGPVRPTQTLAIAEVRENSRLTRSLAEQVERIEQRLSSQERRLAPIYRERLAATFSG